MRMLKPLLLASSLMMLSVPGARAEVKVLASIKPVHSLVASVMQGVGEPGLIVDGAGSPHTYALKPSQAAALQMADVVFWIGHELEPFLEKPLETIASGAKAVELMDAEGLRTLPVRDGGAFEKHGQDDHAGHGHDHGHESVDTHVWLDPENARAMTAEIARVLGEADPANAVAYEANAKALEKRLDELAAEISSGLAPVKGKGFIVFHDAYQYFEARFGVQAAGSITVSPEVMPGAERVAEMRAKVQELGATCVFAEPQFEPKLISTITEGTRARAGVIDPLGSQLSNGPGLYEQLMRNMAGSIRACLSGES